MIGALALLLATVLAIELLAVTGLVGAFRDLSGLGGQSVRLLLRTGVSEWAKERAMRLMALRLILRSLRTGALIALVAMPIVGVLMLDGWWPFGVRQAFIDGPTRIGLLVVTSAYAVLRRRRAKPRTTDGDTMRGQGRGERLLQHIALGMPPVLDLSFDLERRRFGRAAGAIPIVAPVFVTGLARGGTTILMRALHENGGFASLSYRDLPFPLAPNMWSRMAGAAGRHVEAGERGHGDGLLHDLDTPEAIEEVFWRHHEGAQYCTASGLEPAPPSAETVEAFGDYVRLVLLRYERSRYLSKNNANILRLPALLQACPDALLVHPFRDPLQQAASLLGQHRRACTLAAGDPYRARFMGWMGHHEFGARRKPFLLPDGPSAHDDPNGINYWLKTWIGVYSFLLHAPSAVRRSQIFVDYDEMCAAPGRMAQALGFALEMEATPDLGGLRPPPRHIAREGRADLIDSARALHRRLQRRSDVVLFGEHREPLRA